MTTPLIKTIQSPMCGICRSIETSEQATLCSFPSHVSTTAHSNCFQKINDSWKDFVKQLKETYGDQWSSKHTVAMRLIDQTELTLRRKNMLQLVEDPAIGLRGLSIIFTDTLEILKIMEKQKSDCKSLEK